MLAALRKKNLHTWLPGYAAHLGRRLRNRVLAARNGRPRHLLFAVCDHYEPLWGKKTPRDVGLSRVKRWSDEYPRLTERFRDADGHAPRHSFFFPGEEYAPSFLDELAGLVRAGLGEVELHLHHDNDTAANLRACIEEYLDLFAEHGHISRLSKSDSNKGYRYAFIHGNWCLANARADGRWCGVDDELPLLFGTGCYADFTFPSAPDECQPPIVNQIYWPTGELSRRRAYQQGTAARVGEVHHDRLLMMTGPLALARRPGGLRPRIESAALDAGDPPSPSRVHDWVRQNIHIAGRPEWVFVKVHTHGAPEANAAVLLGAAGIEMHETLQASYNDGERWRLHYVTAREMYNVALAAMTGESGDAGEFRNFDVPPPPLTR